MKQLALTAFRVFPRVKFSTVLIPRQLRSPIRAHPSRGLVHTVTATNTLCQWLLWTAPLQAPEALLNSLMAVSSFLRHLCLTMCRPRPQASGPTSKQRRKRADAWELYALNRMYARTAFSSTEEHRQLARGLDISARRVQIWLARAL